MTSPAVLADDVGKQYQIGLRERGYRTLRDTVSDLATAPLRRFKRLAGRVDQTEKFWALRGVSFQVQPGAVVGIIGRNGAGKSTLLKILSRITEPTTGFAQIRGRVSSLLEVGTGFHPELTGRENIFLNGSILGMSRSEIKGKFEEIVEFSGVKRFIDTPVKRYSSGMQVRLAFAVAAHLEPEILLVDEVLAVGDAAFQKKCLGKMRNVAEGGRTVLFVSHNMGAVGTLCSRVVQLEEGRLIRSGTPRDVIDAYIRNTSAEVRSSQGRWFNPAVESEDEDVSLRSVELIDASRQPTDTFAVDESFSIVVDYRVKRPIGGIQLGVRFQSTDGVVVFTSCEDSTAMEGRPVGPGEYRARCTVPQNLLNNRTYVVLVGISEPRRRVLVPLEPRVEFTLIDTTSKAMYPGSVEGVVRPKLEWTVRCNGAAGSTV